MRTCNLCNPNINIITFGGFKKETMTSRKKIFFLLPFTFYLLPFTFLSAQTATVRGFVYDKESGEPVIFTNVYLKGTTFGAATDVNGYYAISKIPPASYTLTVTYLGFDTLSEEITLKENQILNRQLHLQKSSINLKTVEISAEKMEQKTEVKMSVQKITPKEIKQIPSIGGEADIAQYLQVLPGVIFTGDQGGQLYIRGGSPIQNKVLLDGMVIYNPFHSIGLFSVFDTDIIRNADIYTGGFNAQYGGRISSVMDIRTRDGNKSRYSGRIGSSAFGARALIEGPIFMPKQLGGSSASFIFSAKQSYLNSTSKFLYYPFARSLPKVDGKSPIDSSGLPFNFTDLYAKVSFNGSSGSKVNVFGFNFADKVKWKALSDLHWNTSGAGSNFILVPEKTPVLVEGNFAYSKYDIALLEGEKKARTSSIDGFNMGLHFTYFIKDDEIKYGMEILGFSTKFNFFNEFDRSITQEENTTELAGYLKYRLTYGKLVFEPSFRGHYYAAFPKFSPEPRMGLKYNITDFIRFKSAAGLYSQNLISANSDRDVVNLFYGFLSGPDNLQKTFTDENGKTREITHQLQKAYHVIAGFEVDITKKLNLNMEGYYKRFLQLSNLNRNKIFEDNADNTSRPDYLKKDFIIETGNAYGCDFVLKYDFKRLYLWLVYSIAKVTRFDGVLKDENGKFVSYYPVFDRRHNVNFVSTYTFGKNLNWEASARWNLGSGFPFTQTQGYYERYSFTNGINTNYTNSNGELGIQYSGLNQGRLPFYHRLDLNVKRIFPISENSIIEATAGVTNAYNRRNIFYFDRVRFQRVDQLPLMPNVGVVWTF